MFLCKGHLGRGKKVGVIILDTIICFFRYIIDWSQFIPALIATSLGCSLAILFTSKYDKKNSRAEQDEVKHHVFIELDKVASHIRTINTELSQDPTHYYLTPLKTPVFDSLIHTKKIGSLFRSFQSDETEIVNSKSILMLYDKIVEYNDWHTWRTNNKEQDTEFAKIHIEKLGNAILNFIEKLNIHKGGLKNGKSKSRT